MNNNNIALLKIILETKRDIMETTMFNTSSKLSLLNFIGADKYFITDFGLIWSRDKVYPNKLNMLTRYYLPMRILDIEFPYPWVLLPTGYGNYWFPINQLLGWAFTTPNNKGDMYFLCDHPELYPYDLNRFHWYDSIPFECCPDSLYYKFIQSVYCEPF